MPHKLLSGTHTSGDKTYQVGDIIPNLSDRAVKMLGKRIQKEGEGENQIGANPDDGSAGTGESKATLSDSDADSLLSQSIPDIENSLLSIYDVAALEQIRARELQGKQRAGVMRAIKDRREQLTENKT